MGRGEGRGEGGARDRSDHGEGRAGAGQDLGFHQCPSCGLDCGTTSGLYRHVVVRCLDQLGQSIEEFKRKFQLRWKRDNSCHGSLGSCPASLGQGRAGGPSGQRRPQRIRGAALHGPCCAPL